MEKKGGYIMKNDEEKSELEKTAFHGAHGTPELKKDEKNRFLGEFAERVICYLNYNQLVEPGIYPEVVDAIKSNEAKKLVISREVELNQAQDYIKIAKNNGLKFKRVDSPEHKGEISLIVASNKAVDIEEKSIMNRREKLKKKGIADNIIDGVGKKLCPNCWKKLKEKAEEELINYKKMSWIEKLAGEKCIKCDND